MALFRLIRVEYEKAIRMGHLNGIRVKGENVMGTPLENGSVVKDKGVVVTGDVKGS